MSKPVLHKIKPINKMFRGRMLTGRKEYFNFNPPGVKFNGVYATIQSFYPIGIEKREGSMYYEYEGLRTFNNLLIAAVHNRQACEKTWQSISSKFQTQFSEEIVGTTGGQAPSISGYVNLYSSNDRYHRYEKRLYFYISLLGPYYTLFGMDLTTIFDDEDIYRPLELWTNVNSITVSPYKEYASSFAKAQNILQRIYAHYKLAPYYLYSKSIKGLQVPYLEDEDCNVFNALFGTLPEALAVRGDEWYGIQENWK